MEGPEKSYHIFFYKPEHFKKSFSDFSNFVILDIWWSFTQDYHFE